MAKRFTATEKWEDQWFRRLKPTHKLLWLYMLDRCDMAGVIEFDLELAEVFVGAKIDAGDFDVVFKNRVFKISESKAWIPKFIEFQYGCTVQELDPKKPLHIGVLKSVTRYNLTAFFDFLKYPIDTPDGSIHTPQVKVEVGVEVKDKNIETISDKDFEPVWKLYPNRQGKKEALRHFRATVKTADDLKRIHVALTNYLKSERVSKGFIQNGSTWFNDWECWIEPSDIMVKARTDGSPQRIIKKPCQYCHDLFDPSALVGHELKCPKAPKPADPDSPIVKHALDEIKKLTNSMAAK